MKVLICRTDEVESILLKMEIDSVLSIEHPNSVDGMGRAPRLENVEQKIISF
jgi:hypothetical protein